MHLTNAELIAAVCSPAFLVVATSAIRKYVKLDGWTVPVFVFLLGEMVAISARMVSKPLAWTDPTEWIYGALTGLMISVAALGLNEKGNQFIDRIAKKLQTGGETTNADSKAGPDDRQANPRDP